MLLAAGLNPEEIIQNPAAQQQAVHPSQMDAGGVQDGQQPLNVQPNVEFQGGGQASGNGRTL